jgi:glycosyltransferase involved in cell wall biosynthesis
MNVVFDGICLGDGPITGVARAFLTGLTAYAERFGPCTLLLPRHAADPRLANVAVAKAPRGAVPRQLLLPLLLRELRADVLHSSVAAIPLSARCATVATAHDLPWHHRAEGETSSWRARQAAERSFARATAVIAPSTATADDVRKTAGVGHHKVHVIPHGVALDPNPPAAAARNEPFLALGDDRPRKNRDTVQQAHRLAGARDAQLPELQFVGPPSHYVD